MKTVYTVTFHTAMNYGAVLQAYALQQVLSRRYYTAILNYNPAAISDVYRCFKRRQGTLKNQIIRLAKDVLNCKKDHSRNKHFENFRKNFLQETTTSFKTSRDVINNYPHADFYITGSDQVWNPTITKGLDSIYTLNFGQNNFKKIAYAASAGNNNNLNNNLETLTKRLHSFEAISVRERQLQQLLNTQGINTARTVDPSLLLTKDEWQNIIPRQPQSKKKYILAYSWDEPEIFFEAINQYAQLNKYTIYYYRRHDYKKLFRTPKKSYFEVGPCEFLALLQNAECVFTTSFHGTALSSILNKDFYAFLANSPDRITTLLKSINLSDRIITNMQEFDNAIHQKIDWKKTNQLLDRNRQDSIEWLYNTIGK